MGYGRGSHSPGRAAIAAQPAASLSRWRPEPDPAVPGLASGAWPVGRGGEGAAPVAIRSRRGDLGFRAAGAVSAAGTRAAQTRGGPAVRRRPGSELRRRRRAGRERAGRSPERVSLKLDHIPGYTEHVRDAP